MNPKAQEPDHPIDALPDYARGAAADAEEIERHLAGCERCRLELEIVRALAAGAARPLTDIERRGAYRAFETRRVAPRPPRRTWLAVTWRTAAGIALLLTSVGVWRMVDGGVPASEWNPEAALEGFRRDLAELGVDGGDARAVLGGGLLDDPAGGGDWTGSEDLPPGEERVPWEVER